MNGPAWAKAVPVGSAATANCPCARREGHTHRERETDREAFLLILPSAVFLSCEAGCWCYLAHKHAAVKIPAIVSFRPVYAAFHTELNLTDRPQSREFQVVVLGAGEHTTPLLSLSAPRSRPFFSCSFQALLSPSHVTKFHDTDILPPFPFSGGVGKSCLTGEWAPTNHCTHPTDMGIFLGPCIVKLSGCHPNMNDGHVNAQLTGSGGTQQHNSYTMSGLRAMTRPLRTRTRNT